MLLNSKFWILIKVSRKIQPLFDITSQFGYPTTCPGRPGAAKPFEPRQDRKVATVRKSLRVPPVACPDIFYKMPTRDFAFFVYNPIMTSSNIIKLAIAAIFGIALGLIYGWLIDPIEYVDVPPNILREDYRVDYVLMVAESYQKELDPDTAARRLAVLGGESPAFITGTALEYAKQNAFTENEMKALEDLLTAMQTYQPQGNIKP